MTPAALKPQWIAVHPARLAEFGTYYDDGGPVTFMGQPMTGVPLYSHQGLGAQTIRIHTEQQDFDVPLMLPKPEPARWVRAEHNP